MVRRFSRPGWNGWEQVGTGWNRLEKVGDGTATDHVETVEMEKMEKMEEMVGMEVVVETAEIEVVLDVVVEAVICQEFPDFMSLK